MSVCGCMSGECIDWPAIARAAGWVPPEEVEAMRKLCGYTQHARGCTARGVSLYSATAVCDCGLHEALAALDAARKAKP